MSTSKVVEIKERLDRGEARMEPERPQVPPLRVLEVRDFLRLELPPSEMLLDPILPAKGLAMMFAPRGVGKTHVSTAAPDPRPRGRRVERPADGQAM